MLILIMTAQALSFDVFFEKDPYHNVVKIASFSGLVSLSWYPTALKLGPDTSFCLLHTHSFLSFSHLAGAHFSHCVTQLAIHRILFQLFRDKFIFSSSQQVHKYMSQ